MEKRIGETFYWHEHRLKVAEVEDPEFTCTGCWFFEHAVSCYGKGLHCMDDSRTDHTNVIFKVDINRKPENPFGKTKKNCNPEELQKMGWISVTEKLPWKCRLVNVMLPDGRYSNSFVDAVGNWAFNIHPLYWKPINEIK